MYCMSIFDEDESAYVIFFFTCGGGNTRSGLCMVNENFLVRVYRNLHDMLNFFKRCIFSTFFLY